jgi:hypothetical protein
LGINPSNCYEYNEYPLRVTRKMGSYPTKRIPTTESGTGQVRYQQVVLTPTVGTENVYPSPTQSLKKLK